MPHVSRAKFRYDDTDKLIAFWRQTLGEHELTPEEAQPGHLIAETRYARLSLRTGVQSCEIEIACDDPIMLPDIRTGISEHLVELSHEIDLRWSNAGAAGDLPPSLSLGKVVGCEPLGSSWWRMTVQLDPSDLARFTADHWHFRLIRQTNADRSPVWPTLTSKGTISWPDGEDALIDRVFTTRVWDSARGTLTFDIFRHPGGPTSDWAAMMPLDCPIGLMGPGGQGGPAISQGNGYVLAAGDETAVPAILRGLEELPEGTSGQAFLLVRNAMDIQPTRPTGLGVTWLLRDDGATEEDLVSRITGSPEIGDKATWLWFAASQSAARAVRTKARARLPRKQIACTGYWS